MQQAWINGSWTISRHSGANNNCVELRQVVDGGIEVRDSKNRQGPTLPFGKQARLAFTEALKASRFDTR